MSITPSIRRRKLPFALLTCLLLLAGGNGCDDQQARRRRERREVERIREQLAVERKNARDAVHSRRNWQLMAGLLGVTGVVLLVVGTAMGSGARKDAEQMGETDET